MKIKIQLLIILINDNNLIDTFRYFHKYAEEYTYFTHILPNFRDNNIGMRLDYALASNSLITNNKIKVSKILSDIGGSDHLPIYLSYNVQINVQHFIWIV